MHSYFSLIHKHVQRPWISMTAALIALLVISTGLLDQLQPPMKVVIPLMGMFLCWLAWELYQGISHFWMTSHTFDRNYATYMGLGFALLAGAGILLRLSGGLYSPFYPLFFLCIAFLASVGTSKQGTVWFGYAFLIEIASVLATGVHTQGAVGIGALHILYIALFAGSHHVYLHGVLREVHEVQNRKRAVKHATHISQVAKETHASIPPSSTGVTALSLASIDQDKQVLMSRIKDGLDAHGCALLWLDAEGEYLEVSSIVTDAAQFDVGPFPVRSGITASIFKNESALRLSRFNDQQIQLPYYSPDVHVRACLAVPIIQDGAIRGALCMDRIHPVPFSSKEEMLLEATGSILARALESERVMLNSQQNFENLTQVSEIGHILSQASSSVTLSEQALELAMHLVPFDWAFLSHVDMDAHTHTVLATTPEVAYLYQQTFTFDGSLFSLAAKHGCMLPEKGLLRTSGPLVSTEDPPLPELASICILPLMQRGETIGCMVMASQDPQLFADREKEKKLTIFGQQVAGSLANAHHSQQIEHLLRKDSLTGLANHSTLMEGLYETFAAHGATSPPKLGLLLFNIDGFRHINGRYGYLTGDRVLRRVAKVLRDVSEPNDIVSRYSGEEMIMFCKGLDAHQGLKYADHICRQIQQIEFCSSDEDPEVFSVTVSAGLAVCPDHAVDPDTLIHHTIEAMFQAKQRGGNQAVLYSYGDDGVALATPNPDEQATPPRGWGWGSLPSLEDPHLLVDPERWSLASFNQQNDEPSASFIGAVSATPATNPSQAVPEDALDPQDEPHHSEPIPHEHSHDS
jgi:diguanylate cyclase (GGDEF)-like protein